MEEDWGTLQWYGQYRYHNWNSILILTNYVFALECYFQQTWHVSQWVIRSPSIVRSWRTYRGSFLHESKLMHMSNDDVLRKPSWADKYWVLSLGLSSTSWHLGFIIAGWWMSWPEIVFNVSVPKLEPPASLQCCHQLIHPLLRCKFHGQLWVCSIHSNNASGEHTRPSLCPLCLIVLTPWCHNDVPLDIAD